MKIKLNQFINDLCKISLPDTNSWYNVGIRIVDYDTHESLLPDPVCYSDGTVSNSLLYYSFNMDLSDYSLIDFNFVPGICNGYIYVVVSRRVDG